MAGRGCAGRAPEVNRGTSRRPTPASGARRAAAGAAVNFSPERSRCLTTAQNEALNGLHALLTDVRKAVRQERAGDSGLQRTFLVGKRLGPSLREYLLHAGLIRDAVSANLGWLTAAGVTEATVSAIGAKILLVAAADAAQSGKLGLTRAATTNRNALTKELRALVQRIQLAAERAFAAPEQAGILAEFSGASSPAV